MPRKWLTSVAAGALLISTQAAAQQDPTAQQQQQVQQPGGNATGTSVSPRSGARDASNMQVAEKCRNDLRAFGNRLDEEGYWLTGWGTRWGYGTARTAVGPASRTTAAAPTANPRNMVGGPWGRTPFGVMSPRYQIRTLYMAANVLANRGDESGCQTVLQELQQAYDSYVTDLKQAGVEPGEIANWRVQAMAAAQPVTSFARVSLSDVTGTEVRNLKDEKLGTVDDVAIDAKTGEIAFAILGRGGFFGVGEDYVAIPWNKLKATPRFNLLVFNVPENVVAQAPKVDPDRFGETEGSTPAEQQVQQYWEKHGAG